jgi:hypothetical protein
MRFIYASPWRVGAAVVLIGAGVLSAIIFAYFG